MDFFKKTWVAVLALGFYRGRLSPAHPGGNVGD